MSGLRYGNSLAKLPPRPDRCAHGIVQAPPPALCPPRFLQSTAGRDIAPVPRRLAAAPPTHTLMLPPGLVGNMRADRAGAVENEWLGGQLLNELGIATAETEIATFGASKVLVVTRFDRRWQGVPQGGEQKARFNRLGLEAAKTTTGSNQ